MPGGVVGTVGPCLSAIVRAKGFLYRCTFGFADLLSSIVEHD